MSSENVTDSVVNVAVEDDERAESISNADFILKHYNPVSFKGGNVKDLAKSLGRTVKSVRGKINQVRKDMEQREIKGKLPIVQ